MVVLALTAVPFAGAGKKRQQKTSYPPPPPTYIDPYLLAKAAAQPSARVPIIIQSALSSQTATQAFDSADERDGTSDSETKNDTFQFMNAIAVTLEANKIPYLRYYPGLIVTHDAKVKLDGTPSSRQLWPIASGVKPLWSDPLPIGKKYPAIAIVDSGIDKNRADFDMGARVIQDVTITKLEPNSSGDGRGHGTFVAGIAAGSAPGLSGAAPGAPIISLDVMDDRGMARTSDVIAAAEWIYHNRVSKNIRVANFSLHSTTSSNFTKDPLDKAVEKLWFGGVVVVAAAGNYGKAGGPSGVPFAPGNDPFIITVGAIDLEGSTNVNRHEVPSWSAYGFTNDGFRKPEISAAGRYMIGPVPSNATLRTAKPENVIDAGYMRLSGTSFAAPIVAGAAAQILARQPTWTPDQVKGALMLKARFVPEEGLTGAAGVGEVNASRAAAVLNPPNANLALNRFVLTDPTNGTLAFNAVSWTDVAKANASWDSVTWTDVSWSDASWSSVTWSDVTWSDVTWSDVTWSDVFAAEDLAHEDNAEGEVASPTGDYLLTPEEEAAAAADPELGLDLEEVAAPVADALPIP